MKRINPRAGARFSPRSIREASNLFSFDHGGAYDFEEDVTYLPTDQVRIVNISDADIIHPDTIEKYDKIEFGVRKILEAAAIPMVLGDDHSAHIPCIPAFDDQEPVHLIYVDAHLDFVDIRYGVLFGYGDPLRRASEMRHVMGVTQLGIRLVSSSNKGDYEAVRSAESDILSVRDVCWPGAEGVLACIPHGVEHYCTIEIDSFVRCHRAWSGDAKPWRFPLLRGSGNSQGFLCTGDSGWHGLGRDCPRLRSDGITSVLGSVIAHESFLVYIFRAEGSSV